MSFNPHLEALKNRHESLESRILDEDHRPRPDAEALMRLKIEKLRIKEAMERLKTEPNCADTTTPPRRSGGLIRLRRRRHGDGAAFPLQPLISL